MHQIEVLKLHLERAGGIAREPLLAHVVHGTRRNVCPDRDHANTTKREDGHHHVIVATHHMEVVREVACNHRGIGDVARGLLDAPSVGVRSQARNVPLRDGAARTPGDVVEEARHVHLVEDRGEVMVDALLVGLVVVGRDEEKPVGAQLLQGLRLAEGLRGGVGACTANDGDAAGNAIDNGLGYLEVLLVGHRGRLSRGAQHQNAIGPVLKMEVDQALERPKVNGAILVERRDQRHDRSGKSLHVHCFPSRLGAPQAPCV